MDKSTYSRKQWTQEECDTMNKKHPVTCGNYCAYVPPHGWAPEADCPEHDKPINSWNHILIHNDSTIYINGVPVKRCDCGGIIETHQRNNGLPDDWYCIGNGEKGGCGNEFKNNPFKNP